VHVADVGAAAAARTSTKRRVAAPPFQAGAILLAAAPLHMVVLGCCACSPRCLLLRFIWAKKEVIGPSIMEGRNNAKK
jgi:hypothetical protein